ncbi:MAG: hypothetical protein FJY44_11205 [Betaproteobacteria bacterium]|nr:hypothetical protein [Betaproteobacteria bacterium]
MKPTPGADLDDGLDALLADDLDVPLDFVWAPKAQPVPTVQAHRHRPTRRRQEDHRALAALAGQLDPLPTPGETVHLVLHGAVPLAAVVWHIVDRIPPAALAISTLGFNRVFVADLIGRMRTGRITSGVVVCSNYFRKSDPVEYADAAAALAPWPCRLTDARTHAKIAVFGPYSLEGSANLRNCRSVENVCITHDKDLADFHAGWIQQIANTPTP